MIRGMMTIARNDPNGDLEEMQGEMLLLLFSKKKNNRITRNIFLTYEIGDQEDDVDDGKSQSAVELEVYSRALDSNVEVI